MSSGLINQSVIAAGLFVICVTSHEYMKRKRRGGRGYGKDELGSVESWQFGYLYQARSWARKASPPVTQGWPLSWIRQVLRTPDTKMNELRGVDATLYVRIMQGCVWFALAHTFTTFPILLPIHVTFSDASVPSKSMTRASITSLVSTANGASLLWIHLLLLIWLTASWTATLHWIMRGAFRYRSQNIREVAESIAQRNTDKVHNTTEPEYHPHPHPPYSFNALPPFAADHENNRAVRPRTVMVTDIPLSLRSESELKEYFEYYLSRPIAKPTIGVTSSAQPGFIDRNLAFIINRAIRLVSRIHKSTSINNIAGDASPTSPDFKESTRVPVIEKVVLVRKMTELASLLERREDVLTNLEAAHIKLARNALQAIAEHLEAKSASDYLRQVASRVSFGLTSRNGDGGSANPERGAAVAGDSAGEDEDPEDRMTLLVRTLAPFLPMSHPVDQPQWRQWKKNGKIVETQSPSPSLQKSPAMENDGTIWDALLSLPRSTLDTYQPLTHLSAVFRGKTVPTIDYYTAKLKLLNSLITEKRAQPASSYTPMSTAFVTFADPVDARRACKYLAVHPDNPVNVCLVSMAPAYEDLDWIRLMRSTFRVEFVKDWVVNLGVWGFTIFWLFPVSSIVAFVSIQTISTYWPGLKTYLDNHEWQSEVLQSLVPTLLVAILTLLVPLILLLIAKKAHTIGTLSVMHDRIMTRYYKFLIVNVLFFFCVGTATLQTVLTKATSGQALIQAVSESFPSAAPFYVGWLIFTMAVHGCIELALFGLPLILYPGTQRQTTPRKRAVGIRPRTFNFYYWLPNHLLVIHILLLFAVLNPLVIPFSFMYFCVEAVVVKNQLLHVYAKNYEGNGQTILIRLIRYSLDGLILSQAVFLAYMVVLKIKANVAVSAVLIIVTAFSKLSLTRFCRARFERDDLLEAKILCGLVDKTSLPDPADPDPGVEDDFQDLGDATSPVSPLTKMSFLTWKLASRVGLSYGTIARRRHHSRRPMPFRQRPSGDSVLPLHDCSSTAGLIGKESVEVQQPLPVLVNQPIVEEPQELPTIHSEDHTPITLVQPHPPVPAWDDDSNPDTPYDNPYYSRQISETLWLPRDPLSILNMDHTVDMRISLTSDVSAGKLGVWSEGEYATSALSSVFATNFSSEDEESEVGSSSPPKNVDGNEPASASSITASRIGGIDHEHNVQSTTRKPSLLAPRKLSAASAGRTIAVRRRTTETGARSGYRSFSLNTTSGTSAGLRRAETSYLTAPSGHQRKRSASVGLLGLQRIGNSREDISRDFTLHASESSTAPRSIISTRDAVVGEAIVEEQEAAEQRQRQEEAEEVKATEPRPWLISWMFAKRH
ncbi:hypothetical protein NM688_g2150 [Phlebia brevispora]|uniref:Uncharacterized protein n=1 Tax=Phlebia brevispora TaxID=194682 RepID=A0ACC1T9E6_9APHY|nr:hypothetical protein NM688_g2150 [Phlebia brevispora]